MTNKTDDLPEVVRAALKRAYILGQLYWQQADSEYRSQNKKSDETEAKFDALLAETVFTVSTALQPSLEGVCQNHPQQISDEWKQAIDHELVTLGSTADSYSSPKEAINALIEWNVSVATDPLVNGGYKLAPVESTEEMIESGWMVGDVGMGDIYKAMLEAAPDPKGKL